MRIMQSLEKELLERVREYGINPVDHATGPGAGAMGGRTAPLKVIVADGATAAGACRVHFVDEAEHGDDEHR
jgi:hypothetical protein